MACIAGAEPTEVPPVLDHECTYTYVTGPAKTGHICTNYLCSEMVIFCLCLRYSCSVTSIYFLIDL